MGPRARRAESGRASVWRGAWPEVAGRRQGGGTPVPAAAPAGARRASCCCTTRSVRTPLRPHPLDCQTTSLANFDWWMGPLEPGSLSEAKRGWLIGYIAICPCTTEAYVCGEQEDPAFPAFRRQISVSRNITAFCANRHPCGVKSYLRCVSSVYPASIRCVSGAAPGRGRLQRFVNLNRFVSCRLARTGLECGSCPLAFRGGRFNLPYPRHRASGMNTHFREWTGNSSLVSRAGLV
jgi:hypothetical protein